METHVWEDKRKRGKCKTGDGSVCHTGRYLFYMLWNEIKRKLALVLIIIFCMFVLCGCPLTSEWYYELANGYSVAIVGSNHVAVLKNNDDFVVGRFVVGFCYNDKFLGVKRYKAENERDYSAYPDYYTMYYSDDLQYYLVDMANDNVHGPYNEQEYEEQKDILVKNQMSEWIKTDSKPDDASLPIDEVVPKDKPFIVQVFYFIKFIIEILFG